MEESPWNPVTENDDERDAVSMTQELLEGLVDDALKSRVCVEYEEAISTNVILRVRNDGVGDHSISSHVCDSLHLNATLVRHPAKVSVSVSNANHMTIYGGDDTPCVDISIHFEKPTKAKAEIAIGFLLKLATDDAEDKENVAELLGRLPMCAYAQRRFFTECIERRVRDWFLHCTKRGHT